MISPMYESKIVRLIEVESGMVVLRGRSGEGSRKMFKEYIISVMQNEIIFGDLIYSRETILSCMLEICWQIKS